MTFQTHLEASIVRHKSHIMKLELILRLLDNDELSPEQVNDVKDFLDDYVERNQVCISQFVRWMHTNCISGNIQFVLHLLNSFCLIIVIIGAKYFHVLAFV